MHKALYDVAFGCWAKEKEARPTAAQLLDKLNDMLETEKRFHGTVRGGWVMRGLTTLTLPHRNAPSATWA